MIGDPYGYAENYADAHLPPEGDTEDQHKPVGDGLTWWDYWYAINQAYLAGWRECSDEIREAVSR